MNLYALMLTNNTVCAMLNLIKDVGAIICLTKPGVGDDRLQATGLHPVDRSDH